VQVERLFLTYDQVDISETIDLRMAKLFFAYAVSRGLYERVRLLILTCLYLF